MRTDTLSKMTTVEEVLEVVAEFDREAHGFYTDLIPKVSKKIRYIVEDLARNELDHVIKLYELSKSSDIREHLMDAILRPEADRRFSDAIQTPELGDDPDDQEVLQYALARQQIAIEEYSELAANTPLGPMHEVFSYLANEESKHKTDLEALYYEVVHSGGV
ncbi:ferritin family protein [Aliiruegeria lutimaris]|uniref:Rubrerythrin n=1 Tax=Aliiruegeria lutimaris TaxID=571298 RepID=A0A1G9AC12_9RHOB|nr:ferritin family protein [Aliiruegeria lutimaris]SDK24773.1 Rubrerythrin [Aliiruegeria lutimaris]